MNVASVEADHIPGRVEDRNDDMTFENFFAPLVENTQEFQLNGDPAKVCGRSKGLSVCAHPDEIKIIKTMDYNAMGFLGVLVDMEAHSDDSTGKIALLDKTTIHEGLKLFHVDVIDPFLTANITLTPGINEPDDKSFPDLIAFGSDLIRNPV